MVYGRPPRLVKEVGSVKRKKQMGGIRRGFPTGRTKLFDGIARTALGAKKVTAFPLARRLGKPAIQQRKTNPESALLFSTCCKGILYRFYSPYILVVFLFAFV